jgi:hypothetical protein
VRELTASHATRLCGIGSGAGAVLHRRELPRPAGDHRAGMCPQLAVPRSNYAELLCRAGPGSIGTIQVVWK